jgi:S-adenosylhomocysteine hydrolase
MPVLTGLVRPTLERAGLAGLRVALSDPGAVGADVLTAVLGDAGVRVVTPEAGPEMLIETAPPLPHPAEASTGVVSTTVETADRLRSADVAFPVIACHNSRCVVLADRQRGRRIIQDVARLTNKRIAGSRITVTGYGNTARAVAATGHALGATIAVSESDPVTALTACLDGHDVTDRAGDMVFVVDRHPPPALDDLPEGTMVVTPELPAPAEGIEVRPGVWSVRSGEVHVVVPIVERMLDEADLVLSVAALAVARLASTPHAVGITDLPADIDTEVARFALGGLG